MSRIIQVPVTLDSATRRKDRSVRLSFTTTQEIPTDQFTVMDSYHQSLGWLLFKEDQFNEADVPKDDVGGDLKTPSQRLRNVLYVYHMQADGDASKFRAFYEATIQKYIDRVKENLE